MKKSLFLVILLAFLISCEQMQQDNMKCIRVDNIEVKASVPYFFNQSKSQFTQVADSTFRWQDGDRISVFSNAKDCTTQTVSSIVLTFLEGVDSCAWFTNKVGWSLISGGRYNYVAIYPYSQLNARDKIVIDYTGQVQSSGEIATNLHDYDYMYSSAVDPISDSYAEFSFNHIGSLGSFKLQLSDFEGTSPIYKMSLVAKSPVFGSSASYSIDDIALNGKPNLDIEKDYIITMSFGESGIQPVDDTH